MFDLFKVWVAIVFVFLVLSFLGIVFGLISMPLHVASNVVSTTHGVIDKTLNADNALYNYEFFKKQYEDIQAIGNKIVIATKAVDEFNMSAGSRKDWTFEDKTEASRLASIVQGLQSQQEDMVALYNARSKMANRNIFKDGLIPSALQLGSNILR